MPEPATLALFALSAVVLIAIPGPNLIYIVTRSVDGGRRVGVASALGVEAGTLLHVAAAAAGLSALIASSALAFDLVKLAGAAYLVYLGVRALLTRGRAEPAPDEQQTDEPVGRAFVEGALVNVLNPKVSIFFLAFLPQFVDPGLGPATTQVLVLGALFFLIALVLDLLYVLVAGLLSGVLRRGRARRYVTGGIYLALAAFAASGSRKSA
jgi:threonine/homoserine/homoserine lactone efflux protein